MHDSALFAWVTNLFLKTSISRERRHAPYRGGAWKERGGRYPWDRGQPGRREPSGGIAVLQITHARMRWWTAMSKSTSITAHTRSAGAAERKIWHHTDMIITENKHIPEELYTISVANRFLPDTSIIDKWSVFRTRPMEAIAPLRAKIQKLLDLTKNSRQHHVLCRSVSSSCKIRPKSCLHSQCYPGV